MEKQLLLRLAKAEKRIVDLYKKLLSGGIGGLQTLASVLVLGNKTGGTNIIVESTDAIELTNTSLLKKGSYDFGGDGGISRICSNQYEDMWQNGFRHVFDQSGFIRHSTNCFNVIPDETFDDTLRFGVDSLWTLDDGTTYRCTDNTTGAAVWELYYSSASKYKVFTALLTQSGGSVSGNLLSGDLTIGVTYLIQLLEGADFSNVGAINVEGEYFIATGTTPNSWGTGGQLEYNEGAPVVTVLENTIGNIWFEYRDLGEYRLYSNSLFTEGKSWCMTAILLFNKDTNFVEGHIERINEYRYFIYTSENGTFENNILSETPIEIRVYN